jgi:hypothetical protein
MSCLIYMCEWTYKTRHFEVSLNKPGIARYQTMYQYTCTCTEDTSWYEMVSWSEYKLEQQSLSGRGQAEMNSCHLLGYNTKQLWRFVLQKKIYFKISKCMLNSGAKLGVCHVLFILAWPCPCIFFISEALNVNVDSYITRIYIILNQS